MLKPLLKKGLPFLLTLGLFNSNKLFAQTSLFGEQDDQNALTMSLGVQGSTWHGLGKDFSPIQSKPFGVHAAANISNLMGLYGFGGELSATLPLAGDINPDGTNELVQKGGLDKFDAKVNAFFKYNLENIVGNDYHNDYDSGITFGVHGGAQAICLTNAKTGMQNVIILPNLDLSARIKMDHFFVEARNSFSKYNGAVSNGTNNAGFHIEGGNTKGNSVFSATVGMNF